MESVVITIAREYGSGGRIVGQQLAKALGVPFYDKELISLAAKESGFAEEFIKQIEQKKTTSFLFNLYMASQLLPISEQVYLAESKVIKNIAKKSCVIVGRCADYVLRDIEDCLHIFVHAPLEQRIARVRDEYKEQHANLKEFINKQDKQRAAYYNYFTQLKWGEAKNYHLCLDSSIGLSAAVHVTQALTESYQEDIVGGTKHKNTKDTE